MLGSQGRSAFVSPQAGSKKSYKSPKFHVDAPTSVWQSAVWRVWPHPGQQEEESGRKTHLNHL
jgi:hypothetical protein